MLKKLGLTAMAVVLLFVLVSASLAQRPRAVVDDTTQPTVTPPAAPEIVKAKYEGGVFGYPHKKTGTLHLDVSNNRVSFRDDKRRELFSIPFASITGAYGDTHSVRPAAATVVSHIPYGFPASFIKTKVRYLTLQYDDPDSKVSGATSFRLENKDILDSVLYTLATKSGLIKRGEIYVRKKE